MSRSRRRRCRLYPQVEPPCASLANSLAPAHSSLPATARPSSTAAQGEPPLLLPPPLPPRRLCLPALPPRAPQAGRDRSPCARHRTGAADGNLPAHLLRPRPHLSADFLRPNPALASLTLAMTFLRPTARQKLPCAPNSDRPKDSGRPPFPARASLPARSGRRDRPSLWPARSSARPAPCLGRGDQRPRETLPTAVLPDRPFCPRPAARPRAPSGLTLGHRRRQRDAFILWRPNEIADEPQRRRRCRLYPQVGPPAALPSQTTPPFSALLPAGHRPPIHPAAQGEPPLPPPAAPATARRLGFPRSPVQSASGRRDRPPFARHRTGGGGRETCPLPFRPRPHLPPTPGGRIALLRLRSRHSFGPLRRVLPALPT